MTNLLQTRGLAGDLHRGLTDGTHDATGENGRSVFAAGRGPAWRGIGVEVPADTMEAAQALQTAGLAGWELSLQSVYSRLTGHENFLPIRGVRAVTRATDSAVLGVVGERYRIVSNEDAFAWADALVGGPGCHYQAAGYLRRGSVVWLVVKTPFRVELPDSPIDTYLLLSNSHDGSSCVRGSIISYRLFCANQLRSAVSGAKTSVSIRHTRNAEERLAEAQRVLGLAQGAADRMEQLAANMIARRFTDDDLRRFFDQLVPRPEEKGPAQTIAETRRTEITRIYREEPDQQPILGTAWGIYNAVAAYNDHFVPSRNTSASTAEESRFERITGPGANLTTRALALLTR